MQSPVAIIAIQDRGEVRSLFSAPVWYSLCHMDGNMPHERTAA